MAPRKTTPSTLQRVRRVLLLGLLVFVGALVGLYLFGRRPAGAPPAADREQTPASPEVTIIGNKFRYEVTEDGEKLFDIEADRLLSDESDLYILEGVKISMRREDGREYSITADSGTYRLEVNEATLEGNVVLTGSNGLRLETEGLELSRRGRLVISSAPVAIAMGETYRGRAARLEVFFPRNRIVLAGRVTLETAPGVEPRSSLSARRTVFFRDTHNFLAEGRVELKRENDTLKARRLSLNFDDQDRKILFAQANWQVRATLHRLDDEGETIGLYDVAGDELSIVFDEETGDPERLEIGSPDGAPARLSSTDTEGVARIMTADYLWGTFEAGRLRVAQGLGGVVVDEANAATPGNVLRHVASDSADASYDETGVLGLLSLDGGVRYEEGDLVAEGDRLTAHGTEGVIELVGNLAWIENAEGRLEAPQLRYQRDSGRAEALGGVRAAMAAKSGPDLASDGQVEQPVRIEAARAEWTKDPETFLFDDNVRAWQGENFLVAQSLAMMDDELVADGGVRSVWHQRTSAAGGEGEPDDAGPISIAAQRMRYIEPQGRLVYEGSARIAQGGRSMSCPLLQLEMNDDQEFERMYCEGGTQIGDEEGGSQIRGNAAIYNTAESKVKILGEPVTLNQASGGTISARLMVYDFETAIAEVDSVKDEDADLFMTSSEYFQQFGVPTPVVGAPPAAGEGTLGSDPATTAGTGDPLEDPASAEPPDPQSEPAAGDATRDPTDPPAAGDTTPPTAGDDGSGDDEDGDDE